METWFGNHLVLGYAQFVLAFYPQSKWLRWLARVGKERLGEIENPELAMQRMKEIDEKKGYPKEWIDKRMRRHVS